ncbi:MAG: hypothetical protein HY819_13020 [Acidobacteria bacterium]|nr:hypothetical protein [Acidobacteriota bacterium]
MKLAKITFAKYNVRLQNFYKLHIKNKMARLILIDVKLEAVNSTPNTPTEATVVLSLKGQRITGTHISEPNQEDLAVIACATLNAVQQALPVSVEFSLRNAIRLNPQFLDTPLLVVIADLSYGRSKYELTGACQCEEVVAHRGIAQAALDATNRLVQFILSETM